MNIGEKEYHISHEKGVIRICGRLTIMNEEYEEIRALLEKIVESEPHEITLDIRDLELLNSPGIKTLAVDLILGAADREGLRMKILCSNRYTWQKETIPTFEHLMDGMEIVFE